MTLSKNSVEVSWQLRFIEHVLNHQGLYLSIFLVIILMLAFTSNVTENRLLIIDGESYYHLKQAEQFNWKKINYAPLYFLTQILSVQEHELAILPLFLGIICLLLFLNIAGAMNISKQFTFYFSVFLIMSPAFISSFSGITAYSGFLFLTLCGITLLLQKKSFLRILALLPLSLAAFFDIFSTLTLIAVLIITILKERKKEWFLYLASAILITILLLVNILALDQSFILGPFHHEQAIPDLISDLGGAGGMSFFLFILTMIGLFLTWKKKSFYPAYALMPLFTLAFIYNTNIGLHVTVLAVFFATAAFIRLLERRWVLVNIKNYVILLLILGLIFSTFTYIERIPAEGISKSAKDELIWLNENTGGNDMIFSTPEISYFVNYFAKREPFYSFHEKGSQKEITAQTIFDSNYSQELVPMLKENNISIIYIPKNMKAAMPQDRGFLFLLRSEKFKLVHSSDVSEVWVFKKDGDNVP